MSAVLEQLDTFGPQRCEQLTYEQADEYTRRLARTQYENFTVVSWLLPVRLRADFQHVYAFCRWADDLGDETGDTDRSHELLAWWRDELTACYQGDPRHPVFVALAPTIEQHDIPRKPFDDLIDAFVQDQTVTRYDTWDQAIDYCTRSADPVGRLVLYLCGYRDAQRQQFSDATCTALQLINFWQDVRRDIIERDRVYVPRDIASRWSWLCNTTSRRSATRHVAARRTYRLRAFTRCCRRTKPPFANWSNARSRYLSAAKACGRSCRRTSALTLSCSRAAAKQSHA